MKYTIIKNSERVGAIPTKDIENGLREIDPEV